MIVVVVPVPVIPPGIIVQVPVAGRPLNTTLPVVDVQETGCVIVPTIGAVGAEGATFIITSEDGIDIHPAALVTLKLYVPGVRFAIVVVVPVPAIAPGLIIHIPVAGRPLRTTLPVVAIHQEGCVTLPTIGAVGATGAGLITTVSNPDPCRKVSFTGGNYLSMFG